MNIPKQMINLLGAVVVVAVVVAGVTLAGLPLFGSAQTTDASTRSVSQTNQIYEIQVSTLAAANDRIDEIDADLTALQNQVPTRPRLDDVVEIVVAAAASTGGTIVSIEAADIEAWTPRTGLDSDEQANTAPTDDAAPEDAAAEDAAATAEGGGDATGTSTDAAAEEPESPQKQISVTIEIAVTDAGSAAKFMDALGRGPRLIAPIDGTLDDGVLTVTALAFLRTGD